MLARGNRQVPEVAYAVCDRIGVSAKELDLLVTNQPNRVFLRNWREALELPAERHVDTFDECGNLFAAGIPVNLDRAISDGQLNKGDVVMMAAFAHAGDFAGAAAVSGVVAPHDRARGALMRRRGRRCRHAVNPLALSLNENPFPPLPSVRSALVASLDAANRYPEFLPERLRALIAGRVGVRDEQVVIGAGATGVVMQVLHAVTSPGDPIVMTSPTFDGYPIFAQMARLESVTVALDRHGHHDLDAMADAAPAARVVVLCRPHNPTGTVESAADVERFLRRVPAGHRRAARRGVRRVPRRPSTGSTRLRWSSGTRMSWCCGPSRRPTGWPGCGSATASAPRTWLAAVDHAAAVRHRHPRAWWRSRPHMMRKPNCSNAFG